MTAKGDALFDVLRILALARERRAKCCRLQTMVETLRFVARKWVKYNASFHLLASSASVLFLRLFLFACFASSNDQRCERNEGFCLFHEPMLHKKKKKNVSMPPLRGNFR